MPREWLEGACARLVRATGDDAPLYAVGDADVVAILELARIAAHESGDRTNAPLATYLLGIAVGRHGAEADVAGLAAVLGGDETDA